MVGSPGLLSEGRFFCGRRFFFVLGGGVVGWKFVTNPGAGGAFFAGEMESAYSGKKMYLAGAAAVVTGFFHGRHGWGWPQSAILKKNFQGSSWDGLFLVCLAGVLFLLQRLDSLRECFAQSYPSFKHASRAAGNTLLLEHEAFVIIVIVIFTGKAHRREPSVG